MIPSPPTTIDRLWNAFRQLVGVEIAKVQYQGIYEYVIMAADGAQYDVAPTDISIGLPTITDVTLRTCLLGESVTLQEGTIVRLCFVNGDETRPVLVGADPTPITSSIDAEVSLSLGPTVPAVSIGETAETVDIGPVPLPLASGPAVITAWAAIAAFVDTIAATMQLMTNGYSSLSTPQKNTFTGGLSTFNTAMTAAGADTATTVVKGT
jgi:hypothetical protein